MHLIVRKVRFIDKFKRNFSDNTLGITRIEIDTILVFRNFSQNLKVKSPGYVVINT